MIEQLGKGGFAPVWLAREVYGATVLRSAAVKLFSLHGDDADPSDDAGLISRQILDEA